MITVAIYYTGEYASAFAEEMIKSGICDEIRKEPGNISYQYYIPLNGDNKTVLLIDQWKNQAALDVHHALPLMKQIAELRDKYHLSMRVHRFIEEAVPESDQKYIKK